METLKSIWDSLNSQGLGSDKADVHSYLPIYEKILAPYRETAKNILEIGIFKGHSLLMWEKYFKWNVHGIDCSETPIDGMADLRPMIATGKHNIHILDATDPLQVEQHFNGMKLDIVIDDGNHVLECQLKSYNIFKNYLADDFLYIIEDVDQIERVRPFFENLDDTKKITIIDNRHIKGRFDDCLIIIQPK